MQINLIVDINHLWSLFIKLLVPCILLFLVNICHCLMDILHDDLMDSLTKVLPTDLLRVNINKVTQIDGS